MGQPEPSMPYSCDNGSTVRLRSENRYILQTKAGFNLEVKFDNDTQINITEYEKSPRTMDREQHRIRTQTMMIEANVTTGIMANLSFAFTSQVRTRLEVQNIEKLKFMYYSETTGEWKEPEHQWLDGESFYCNTTQFSLWTIAEEETSTGQIPGFTLIPLILALVPIILKKKELWEY